MRGQQWFIAALLWAAAAAPASSQGFADRPVHRFEVSIGGGYLGGGDLGETSADIRANRTERTPYTLFKTESRFVGAPLLDLRVGFGLTRRLVAEFGFARSEPELRTAVSGDVEGAPSLTVAERVDQYFVDGSVLFLIDEIAIGDRVVPFASGGIGYLRQLHEGRTLIETGQVYHVGGGVKASLMQRSSGFLRAVGLRGDVRAYILQRGISLDERSRTHGAVSGGVFVTF